MYRSVWHFTRRILRSNVALSGAAALATWVTHPIAIGGHLVSSLGELLLRFAIAACTVGYGLSFLVYRAFYRHELPIYLNAGLRVSHVLGLSWILHLCVLGTLAAALLIVGSVVGR